MDEFLQQLVNGLSWGAIYALIAVGYTMVYGVLRLINFAHGEVYMVGAYAAFYTAGYLGLPYAPDVARPWIWGAAGLLTAVAVLLILLRARGRSAVTGMGGFTFALVILLLLAVAALTAFGALRHAQATSLWFGFAVLLLAAMVASGVLGFTIELLAYRPLRNQPRINALITAIGVSLLLQYGGQRVFGATPRSFPVAAIPQFLPGTRDVPDERLDPVRLGRRLLYVDLIGTSAEVWWTNPPAATGLPATAPSPAPAAPPTTASTTRVAAVVSTRPAASTLPVATRPAAADVPRATLPPPPTTQATAATTASPQTPAFESRRDRAAAAGLNPKGFNVPAHLVLVLVLTLALMLVLRHVVLNTKTGLALRAVSFRFDTAALMGININRIISFTFVLGSSMAGAAGVLIVAAYPQVWPFMGEKVGLKAFVAAVLGGIGNIPGAVLGGFLLGLTETLVAAYLPNGSQYKDAIAYSILIVILLAKPTGLLGKPTTEKV